MIRRIVKRIIKETVAVIRQEIAWYKIRVWRRTRASRYVV